MPIVHDLRTALKARAAGLGEPAVRAILRHLEQHPDDEQRALTLAVILRDVGADTETLRRVLASGLPVDRVFVILARQVTPALTLSRTGEQVLRCASIN